MNLVLIRHGKSVWNLENKFTGWYDIELAPEGIIEAEKEGFSYSSAYWTILKAIFNKENNLYLGDKEATAWSKIPIFLNMFPEGNSAASAATVPQLCPSAPVHDDRFCTSTAPAQHQCSSI